MRNQKPLFRYTLLNPILFATLIAAGIIAGANRFAWQSPPDDPWQRVSYFTAAGMPAEAGQVYRQLLGADPLNLDLHVAYIQNHFRIPAVEDAGRADPAVKIYYTWLAHGSKTSDVGRYGLGLIQALQGNYGSALAFYEQVTDRDQEHLNGSTGWVYRQMGDPDRAEGFYRREIAARGDLAGAVTSLASLYSERNQVEKLRALAADAATASFIPYPDQRRLALLTGDLLTYLELAFIEPLRRLSLVAVLCALLICVVWLLYFWRIDVFSQKPLPWLLLTLIMGGGTALGAFALGDVFNEISPLRLGKNGWEDLLFSVVHVGMVEEAVKLLPVILGVLLSRRVREPFDLVIYGSLSALGFATLENALYFTGRGLDILFYRFLFSTVMHLSMTSIASYAWVRARYIQPGSLPIYLLAGYTASALVHGLFDYFVLSPTYQLPILSLLLLILMAREYHRVIRNALNLSPFFREPVRLSPRLDNFGLLFSAAFILLAIVYLYNNFNFSTEIADQQLRTAGLVSLPAVLSVFGSLGKLSLNRGSIKPALPRLAFRRLAAR